MNKTNKKRLIDNLSFSRFPTHTHIEQKKKVEEEKSSKSYI